MVVLRRLMLQISCILMILSIVIGWLSFPFIFKRIIRKKVSLIPESPARQMWNNYPFPFDFSIHVLNVTNPIEIQNGAKPIVEDVGPFFFEFKDKFNVQDNEAEDSVSFNMRNTYIFRSGKPEGLTGEELVTMPHPIIQMMAIAANRQSAEMIQVVAEGLKVIFNNASPFITAPFMDLFFRGIFIDCSHEHLVAKAVCSQFESGSIKGAKKFNDTHFTFSFMGESNHSDVGHFRVARGCRNPNNVGKVLQINGQSQLDIWAGNECNNLKGTDGTVFPAFIDPSDGLWLYSQDLCRSIELKYRRSVHYESVPASRFVMNFGDIQNEKDNTCFCKSYPDVCPAKGTMDISACTKTPMIASMPHFLHGDENLLKNVDGLNPCDNNHGTHFDMEILSGTPLSVYKRIQFNLDVEPVAEVDGMKKLKKLVMPMFWIDENFNLISDATVKLLPLFTFITINEIFKWGLLVISVFGLGYATFLYNRERMVRPIVDVK